MPTKTLPPNPNLAQLKLQATELKRQFQKGDPSAAARIGTYLPASPTVLIANAQFVIAREYGFESWPKLKHFVELSRVVSQFHPHPLFDIAVSAMDAGDIPLLRRLLADNLELVYARTNLEPPYHYFTGATLLHHVAGNPDRGRNSGELGPMPKNFTEVARLLLDSGADVHARTLGPNGGTTMGLLLTSAQASLNNASGPLIDLLLEYGEAIDVSKPDCLYDSLINHAPRAAEKLIERGAKPDLFAVAALGRLDLVQTAFERKETRVKFHGRLISERDSIGLAMLAAYVRQQTAVVDFLLEKNGYWDMVGVNNGTAMHRAASGGDLEMVKKLVARGADVGNRNNPFVASPLSWADHFGQAEVVAWMRENCQIDIHDAICFNFPEQVEARVQEDATRVNERRDQWTISQATPLHCAAATNRGELARLLLNHGADATLLAGNGLTALEVAEKAGATEVAQILAKRGT